MDLKLQIWGKIFVLISVVLGTVLHSSYGCNIVNHPSWIVPIQAEIYDVHEGIVIRRDTTDIESIISASYGEATLAGPYFDISIIDSQLIVQTNEAFKRYEEVEVAHRISITLSFNCAGGSTRDGLFLWIDLTDTNNNPPAFLPTNQYEFTVMPPLPPGYLVTGCYNDPIIVRDIDLTTKSINFTIQENPYFEIIYDPESSTVVKQFNAQLRTKSLLRSLNEPLVLQITATDVDDTGNLPLTSTGVVRIVPDAEFQFPEELVFSQTFYLANYTDDHQINLMETITLRQGFDEYVSFTLEGGYAEHFDLLEDDNQVSLVVVSQLSNEIISEGQILLVVKAEREYTSGASATIIVRFPEEIGLQFERAIYEGSIVNNSLQVPPLILSQGHEGASISAEVIGEHSTYFTTTAQENVVTLTMEEFPSDIIEMNSFISLQIVATAGINFASTVVNLDIIKDDNVTPVFDQSIYRGSYDPVNGLSVEQIVFVQGFDDTVSLDLVGEYSELFKVVEAGPIITLESATIPAELFSQQNILLSIEARKPLTVGANAAIHISLPAARELEFEESTYRGTIEGGELSLQNILLTNGYEDSVAFNLSGEHSTYFTTTNVQGQVTVVLPSPLPDTVITQNNVIILTLTASGINAVTTRTNILLDIIKYDTTTPVFTKSIYNGTFSGATIDIEAINLSQGLDDNVTFRLDGAYAEYFGVERVGGSALITLQSPIPEDVILNEKVLVFNVFAHKPLTVGANAAILIRFPAELTDLAIMEFSQNTYVGTLDETEIHLENIVIETGFAPGIEFILSGVYAEHFYLSNTTSENIIQLSNHNTLPNEVLANNTLIVLEIEARRARAVSVWTSLILTIVKQEVVAPVFGQAFYTGAYSNEIGLTFGDVINLSEGFDETVTFALSEDVNDWFLLEQDGDSLYLMSKNPIPSDVLANNNHLLFTVLANKPSVGSGRAVIFIDLKKDISESLLNFQQNFYKGYLENQSVILDEIVLQEYVSGVNYTLLGGFAENFLLINENGKFTIQLETPIPNDILEETSVFVLTLEAQNEYATAHTIIVLENLRTVNENQRIEFEQPYYVGSYTDSTGLHFDDMIKLTSELSINVSFDLEGEEAQWFGLDRTDSGVTVSLRSTIPAAVVANNQQLVFVVTAQGAGTNTARATVVIALTDSLSETPVILGFNQVSYTGSLQNNQLNITSITLIQGYSQDVEFTLHGEFADYFSLTPDGAVVTLTLPERLPQQSIPGNRIIVLEIQATAPEALTAYATIVLHYVSDEDVNLVIELVFAQTFYSGSYSAATGLDFPMQISLTQGYDPSVVFDLEGNDGQWFDLDRTDSGVTVTLRSTIPAAVVANNQQLVFVVTAQGAGTNTARATVVIALTDSLSETPVILGFNQVTYTGSLQNNQLNITSITLIQGYSQDVEFTLHGELADYFSLTPDGAVVTLTLPEGLPQQSIPANRIIVLEIRATAPEALTAYATIVLHYVSDEDVNLVIELVFAQTFYSGSYSAATGLDFPMQISLTQGYDPSVVFDLEGNDGQWFDLDRTDSGVTVTLRSTIPAAVVANNQQLVFVVTAQGAGTNTARATVVIALTDSLSETPVILGFNQVTYTGSLQNNQLNITSITLIQGYSQDVEFTLHGELADYFSLTPDGAVVTLTLPEGLPQQSIPANRIIVLEIRATAPEALTAYATIVLHYVSDEDVNLVIELVFAQTFYSGSYSAATGLDFPMQISLTQGYDLSVVFDLEGNDAQWFGLDRTDSGVTVTLRSTIPAAVVANNQQLVFVVTAQGAGTNTARATVVIALTDSLSETPVILGFNQVTYTGSLQNNQLNITSITLIQGYSQDVEFTLHGELADYFSLTPDGAVVTLTLPEGLPQQSIPANRIIVLEIRATAPEALTAYATIVLHYVSDEDVNLVIELVFAQTFYSGSYSAATGLDFPMQISLTQGYDPSVAFDLEGNDAQWFGLDRTDSGVTVSLRSTIPAAVVANNQQLVFVVTAQGAGTNTARATVVIALTDSLSETPVILGFNQVTYTGSLQNNQLNITSITLIQGYSQDVEFTLHGELADYFSLTPDGAVVTLTLPEGLPQQSIPANRIIVLEIRATAPEALTAYATIVLHYVSDEDVNLVIELVFAQTFYSGSYSAATGLDFPMQISLTQGYDPSVVFDLEGNDAQWFGLDRTDSGVTVTLRSTIPAAVVANNQQLVFVVTAQGAGTNTARATVVIALTDSLSETPVILGFNQVTYTGSLQNNQLNITSITLIQGYSQDVEFTLHGELADYFSLTPDGAVVTLTLPEGLPQQSIPANRIIVLEIRATAPEALTAYATIVLHYVSDEDVNLVIELVFAQTFYSGSYSAATGLDFPMQISLTQGYDPSVAFDLEGNDAQWFGLDRTDSGVTVSLRSTIPAAVVANNQQLVFVVTAQGAGTNTARATVVIALTDSLSETPVILGFNQVTYTGSLQNNQLNITSITLIQGYSQDVEFTLHGELADYFSLTPDGAVVTLTLPEGLPQQSIPANRIIVLEIRATAPEALTAYATIVLHYVSDEDVNLVIELVFAQTFYSGSYSAATGLDFPTQISLTQGYDPSVVFDLEGNDAQWFGLDRTDSGVTVTLRSIIPAAVVANNQQLVFVVTAQGAGTNTARATVVIGLIDHTQPDLDVTFDKVLYEGVLQNGVLDHETITLNGFSGSTVELRGEYSTLFEAYLINEEVTVVPSGTQSLPNDVTYVVMEIYASTASAVLLIRVSQSGEPGAPTVSFESTSYAFQVDPYHTGLVGRVHATASNEETIAYSLRLYDDYLQGRLSVNSEGEVHLSTPVISGLYTFEVVANTVSSLVQATATAHLSVDPLPVCGDEYVMAPLIVLDVDEEEPHYDLMSASQYDNCHFTLTNRWPLNHTWVYVDERGLHTTAIDREHESIAYMALSQVQVEVILRCDDDSIRIKRSLTSDALGPYDYGSNKWVLTDTITFNARRSFVNIIVNDINDNAPIFVGKENEPVVVGYPVPELAERVLPRSLVELQATDADIGVNAALLYWSEAEQLAVSPTTGFVHVRDGATLENGSRLTVSATDRNGQGLTGSIDILVRLLDENYIAVVTVRDAFLDDEQSIVSSVSNAIGYELKVLRSVVTSGAAQSSRKRRDASNTAGATLQMYVYGLIASEPVSVERLITEISSLVTGPVIIASSVSLQDHLEGQEICVIAGRDTGLLVATIVLSVLLFILLVAIAVWFFLRWRKNKNYNQFSDENSLASGNVSADGISKPDFMPRLDIAELKKSERRLQEMLETPVEEVYVEPVSSKNDAVVNLPDPTSSIVTIDKLKDADDLSEDEFGEVKTPRRKSVVTFNENVEKIIHLEDTPDTEDVTSEPEFAVYKL